jgi:hypothetical protein
MHDIVFASYTEVPIYGSAQLKKVCVTLTITILSCLRLEIVFKSLFDDLKNIQRRGKMSFALKLSQLNNIKLVKYR